MGENPQSDGRFRNLRIKGFRRLLDAELELRPLSVLIGANGTGKTSVLNVLSLFANSAHGSLNSSISEFAGLAAVLTYDRARTLEIGISMDVLGHDPIRYELGIVPQGQGYAIESEVLSQKRNPEPPPFYYVDSHRSDVRYRDLDAKKLLRPTWDYDPLETALSQVPKMYREPEKFRNRLASSTFYDTLNVSPRSPVRLPQPLQPSALPGKDGETLVSCLFDLQQKSRDRFEAIEDSLRAAFPRFDRLEFPAVAAGTLALAWRETGMSTPFYMHQLSEGTLRFLWLTTLLQSPGLTALTLLDEPEVSLHPELLSMLADMLREASTRTQLVVATHSDRLIRFLNPEEVVVMDSTDDGVTNLQQADKLDISEWLHEYSLDQLWQSGRIGARA